MFAAGSRHQTPPPARPRAAPGPPAPRSMTSRRPRRRVAAVIVALAIVGTPLTLSGAGPAQASTPSAYAVMPARSVMLAHADLPGGLAAVSGVRPAAAATVGLVRAIVALPAAADGTAKLDQVITNLRNWIVGILAALATLFLTIAGLRYLLAGGDPGEVERAKSALRSAAIGYALAILAPAIVEILKQVVGA
jgi:Type IV secretion system pilin